MVHVGRSVDNDGERRLSIIAQPLLTITLPLGIRVSVHTFDPENTGRQTAISRIHISEKPTFWSGGCTSRWLTHTSCSLGFRSSFRSSNLKFHRSALHRKCNASITHPGQCSTFDVNAACWAIVEAGHPPEILVIGVQHSVLATLSFTLQAIKFEFKLVVRLDL